MSAMLHARGLLVDQEKEKLRVDSKMTHPAHLFCIFKGINVASAKRSYWYVRESTAALLKLLKVLGISTVGKLLFVELNITIVVLSRALQ